MSAVTASAFDKSILFVWLRSNRENLPTGQIWYPDNRDPEAMKERASSIMAKHIIRPEEAALGIVNLAERYPA